MTCDPSEIRAAIDDAVSASNELQSLMNYISVDELVGWFVDEGYIDYIDDDDMRASIEDWYDKHC